MENAPEAPAAAPAESEATPITNPEPAQAPKMPDMYGFTSEQLADMRKFYDANGGFDKVKARISNPEPRVEQNVMNTPAPNDYPTPPRPQVQEQPYRAPAGSITAQEFLAKQYFGALSQEEKYANISSEIANGDVLKEMASFHIKPLNQDGSINDQMVRRYLDLKAQTVPAKQSGANPEASAAPTVDYIPVGEKIDNINQAYDIIRQDASLKSRGMAGHPEVAKAEEFIKNSYKDR